MPANNTKATTKPAAKPDHSTLPPVAPDLVDRIFEYIFSDPAMAEAVKRQANDSTVVKLKDAVRAEFKGEKCYVGSRPATARQQTVANVLALFDGRNATEVARRLGISRATVYRSLKQPGKPK